MHPIIENIVSRVNQNRKKIPNPLLRFVHTLITMPIINILGKLTELVTEPVVIFSNDVDNNLRDKTSYLPNETLGDRIKNRYAKVKNALATALKLPVVVLNALIRAILFVPKFVVSAPFELLNNAVIFLDAYDRDDNVLLRVGSEIIKLPLQIIGLPLALINKIIHEGFGGSLSNLSIAGLLTKVENAANGLESFMAKAVIEIIASPLTFLVYASVALGNAIGLMLNYVSSVSKPNTAPPVVQQEAINQEQANQGLNLDESSRTLKFSPDKLAELDSNNIETCVRIHSSKGASKNTV